MGYVKESSCMTCSRSEQCSLLQENISALDNAISKSLDLLSADLLCLLGARLQRYHFDYPFSKSLCWLADKPTVVTGLIDEVRKIEIEHFKRSLNG
jgi:hypothetical protein